MMQWKFASRLALIGWLAGAGAWSLVGPGTAISQAQIKPLVPGVQIRQGRIGRNVSRGTDDDSALDGVFLPPDRQAKRRLELAEEMIGEERYGEGVRLLGALLENPEDFFFKPDPEQPNYRSLKAEASRLLGKLPREGRESYELQFGAKARALLKEAAAKGDLSQITEVSRRFFYTQAGVEATFLLGRNYLDQNRPQAAGLCFERLREAPELAGRLEPLLSLSLASCWLRSGQPEKARQVLARLKQEFPSSEIQSAGKPVKLFASDEQALAWMEQRFGKQPLVAMAEANQWTMHRGDETRNATSSGGRPLLSMRWRQRTCDDQAVEQFVDKLRHDYLSQGLVALSSMHPLAVSDVVVMRTAFAIQAVDFESGKLVWRYPAGDDSLEQFLRALGSQQSAPATQQLLAGLDSRMWEDSTYGTLSSDGERVYFVEDLGLAGLTNNFVTTVLPNGQRRYTSQTRGANRLAARELRTQGKLKWEVGGASGEDEPKLAGAFFLGPPLPLLGSLYALAEIKGQEVRLVVLSPETGALQWSQQLAVVDPPVTQDAWRRNSGVSPSFANGVLVCPTTAGAVVGLDLSTRSLLWGYQYPRVQQFAVERLNMRAAIYPGGDRRPSEHWTDASATVAEGRVLLTPVETDQLFCLDLLDGKELWKQARGTNLYVGCVHRGNIVMVGQRTLSALKLENGNKAWPDLTLPDGALPSGRGYANGDSYYLPLTTAEVIQVNMNTGALEGRARSRDGSTPGNLIVYRDSVISQNADALDSYFQLDALKQQVSKALAANADDPKALSALGEVKLDEGQLAEAIDLFRKSYVLAPDEATREQFVASLLDGLRSDFPRYRDRLTELEGLVRQPRQRLEYLRLKAVGLQQAGEVSAAFEAYIKLLDEDAPWTLDEVDDKLSVRRDRWIREQLGRLRVAADSSAREQIDAVVTARLNAALATQSVEALRSFLNVFGGLPSAVAARDALLDRLGDDDVLEYTVLLEHQAQGADEAQAGKATARLAGALQRAGRLPQAAVYYAQLVGRFAAVDCREGQTGAQLSAAIPPNEPLGKLLALTRATWPEGNVAVRDEKGTPRGGRLPQTVDLEIVGPRGPLFAGLGMSLTTEAQQQFMVGEDGFGTPRFRIPLSEPGLRRPVVMHRTAYNAPSINYVRVYGGLAVLSSGAQLTAIDTLEQREGAGNRVLWTQDLTDQIGGVPTVQTVVPRPLNLPWGPARYLPEDTFGRRFGMIGPVSEQGVYYQRLHDLHCVEPLTGKALWVRKNIGLGHDLFGDDEYLFVAPQGEGDTLVLRAATGEQVGTRKIPALDKRMTVVGRQLLTWEVAGAENKIEMRDVWADKVLWTYRFAAGSKAAMSAQEVLAVLEPGGKFALIRLADGKQLAQEQLQAENSLQAIHLLPMHEGYLLVTHGAGRAEVNVAIQPFPNFGAACPLVSGRVYAFDKATGRKRWAEPVPIAQYGMLLAQPRELPVLVFARQIQRPGPISARDPKLAVICVDKRSGRIVYQKDDLPAAGTALGHFEVTGDPATQSVSLTLGGRLISLIFSEEQVEGQASLTPPARDLTLLQPLAAGPEN